MNPFQPNRWEKQSPASALIWFSPQAAELTKPTSYYVSGTRGSGKTTLLRSIYWKDLQTNNSLKLQKSLTDFEQIGIYLRFPDFAASTGSDEFIARTFAASAAPEWEYADYFSMIVEAQCVSKALSACHELRLVKHVAISAASEQSIVETISERYPELFSPFALASPTFKAAALALDRYAAALNQSLHRARASLVSRDLPAREVGAFLHFACNQISENAKMSGPKGEQAVAFRFCLDDCEVLSAAQQKTVNTLVRVAKHPILWVVSYVGSLVNNTSTLIASQPLTNADRRNVYLDPTGVEFDRKEFETLCQSVVDFRLYYALSEGARKRHRQSTPAGLFPLRGRLGDVRVNDIFDRIVSRLLKRRHAKTFAELSSFSEAAKQLAGAAEPRSGKSPTPRYYEAYIFAHWLGREDAFSNDPDYGERVRLGAATVFNDTTLEPWLRKKQWGALLHFLSKFSPRPRIPVSGTNMILSLADGCIRDFLDMLSAIYDEVAAGTSLDGQAQLETFAFGKDTIGHQYQTQALYRASEQFFGGIATQIDEPRAVTALIDGLSNLTSLLQFNWRDIRTIRTPERGLFVIDFRQLRSSSAPEDKLKAEFVSDVLALSELAGVIKSLAFRQKSPSAPLLASGGNQTIPAFRVLRVHRRLSLEFKFSARGAYEFVRIPAAEIADLCFAGSVVSPKNWAQTLYVNSFERRADASVPGQTEMAFNVVSESEVELKAIDEGMASDE